MSNMDLCAKLWNMQTEELHERQNPKPMFAQVEDPIQEPNFLTVEQMWNDAKGVIDSNDFYAVSIVGPQGSGKTSVVENFASYANDEDYKIIYGLPNDFMHDVKGWINRIIKDEPRAKNCLILDDLSYYNDAQSRKQQALTKNVVSRFRHIFKGKMFCIYVTHRLHAAPPILRNSGSWIFSNMQSADRDDAREIIGKNKESKDRLEAVYNFISKVAIEGPRDKVIHFNLYGNDFTFHWGRKDDPGDGRLMAGYHAGELGIFNSQLTKKPINLHSYRYRDILAEDEDGIST